MVAIIWKNMENNPYQGYFCAGSLIDEEYVEYIFSFLNEAFRFFLLQVVLTTQPPIKLT